ncbi:hypothetical protein ACS0TY_011200 [Phlomoides rotata]
MAHGWVNGHKRTAIFDDIDNELRLSTYEAELLCVVAWKIWGSRNDVVWNGRMITVSIAVQLGVNFWQEWVQSRHLDAADSKSSFCCKKWRLPESGFMKANIDAAFFWDTLEMGLGVIIHDESGRHLFSRSHVMPGLYEPKKVRRLGCMKLCLG